MRTALVASAVTALTLTLTGCGGQSQEATQDDRAATAISDSIIKSQRQSGQSTEGMFQMTRKQADCIGDGFVSDVGTEKLQKYGFLTKKLKTNESITEITMAPKDAKAASDTLFRCADVASMMSNALAANGGVDAETKKCLDQAITEPRLREMFTLMFQGQQKQANSAVMAPIMECAAAAQQ